MGHMGSVMGIFEDAFRKAGMQVASVPFTPQLGKEELKLAVRAAYQPGVRFEALANQFGVPRTTISTIINEFLPDEKRTAEEGWHCTSASWHFQRRLYERYNETVLKFGEYSHIRQSVMTNQAEYIFRQGALAMYAVKTPSYPRGPVFVVASIRNGNLVSALPPQKFEPRRNGWQLKPKINQQNFLRHHL